MSQTSMQAPTTVDRGADRDSTVRVTSFGLSDRGRVRPNNEDHFLVAELHKALRVRQSSLEQPPLQYSDIQGYLFLVADGMGGHQAGQLASTLAVEVVEQFALNRFKWFDRHEDPTRPDLPDSLPQAIKQADGRLCAEGRAHPELRGMGTTVTMAYTLGPRLYVMHVGDSRCYLARGGVLHCLTRDHTFVAELVRRGMISPEEAARHRLRHLVVNIVGGVEPGVEVEVQRAQLQAGDELLLCSDGLTEMIPDDRIARVLAEEPTPEPACRRLVAEANEAGGRDNITIVVAQFLAG
jgi:protein phosphatase